MAESKYLKWVSVPLAYFPAPFFQYIFFSYIQILASLVAQRLKRLPARQETRVQSLGWEDPLEKEMATHSSILAWRIPWTEEPGRLQSTGSQRVRHNWATSLTHSIMLYLICCTWCTWSAVTSPNAPYFKVYDVPFISTWCQQGKKNANSQRNKWKAMPTSFKISLSCPESLVFFPQNGSSSISSVEFSHSVVSDSLRPHELQHTKPPCPSPTSRVYPNSCPSSQWCHPAISSSVIPFSPCPQSFPASGSFPMSQHFRYYLVHSLTCLLSISY